MEVLSKNIIVTWLLPHLPAGQYHDTFQLEAVFTELCQVLETAGLALQGLFFNADKAFDVNSLRQACARRGIEANIPRNRRAADWQTDDDTPLDSELYRRRQVIEQVNAWFDGFKILLVRFETCLHTWLAFTVLLRKIDPHPTS